MAKQKLNQEWQDITPDELRKILTDKGEEQIQLIDVRESFEYKQGHIPQAKLIPLGRLELKLKELDPNKETIVVCASGSRSTLACEFLCYMGFKTVNNLYGGMYSWDGDVALGM